MPFAFTLRTLRYFVVAGSLGLATACVPDHGPLVVASTASAPAVSAPSSNGSPADAGASTYTHDVWMVDVPPLAIYLLARFEEPAGADCAERLRAHAAHLGANRLYVESETPCVGRAYFVRGRQATEQATLRAARRDDGALLAWVHSRWKRPASLSAREAERLCVVVQFSVSPMHRVWNVRAQPIQSSGNRDFDESVRAALESAIDEHADVPAPPDALIGEYVDYRIAFTEGDVRASCREAASSK